VVTPAAAKLSPADKTTLAIEVRDAAGQPVAGAEAAVFVVDEAILSLTGADFASPLDTFYRNRGHDTTDRYLRSQVRLSKLPGPITARSTTPPPPDEADKNSADGEEESGGTGTAMALAEGKLGRKDDDRAEGQYKMKKEASDSSGRAPAGDRAGAQRRHPRLGRRQGREARAGPRRSRSARTSTRSPRSRRR